MKDIFLKDIKIIGTIYKLTQNIYESINISDKRYNNY
jgi:hypothetical protein